MTRNDIMRMAAKSGVAVYGLGKEREGFINRLQSFADLVASAEREACAKVCEPSEEHRREASWGYLGGEEGVKLLDAKAADIRARGQA